MYALAFDPAGRLLAGTGNRGHIFAITGEDRFVDLLKASATQVTAFAEAPAAGCTLQPAISAKYFCWAGRRNPRAATRAMCLTPRSSPAGDAPNCAGPGKVELFARSGNVDNPDRNWSPWKPVDLQKDPVLNVPPARFIQWKAVLHAGTTAPSVDSVLLNYLPKNVAPDFDDVSVQVGVRYQPLPKPAIVPDTSGRPWHSQPRFDAPPPSTRDPDSIGVKWTVHDDNDDQMVYSVLLPRRRRDPLAAAEGQSDRQVLSPSTPRCFRMADTRSRSWRRMRPRILRDRR